MGARASTGLLESALMGQWLHRELGKRSWLMGALCAYLALTAVELVRVSLVDRPVSADSGLYGWELAPATTGAPLSGRLLTEDGGTPGAPAQPGDVIAFAHSSDLIQLTWTDRDDSEQGFKLQRATPGGTWSSIWIGHDQTSWLDGNVRGGTWCYRVRSFNAAGQSLYAYPSPPCVDARAPVPFRWTAGDAQLVEPLGGAVVTIPLYVARPDIPESGIEVVLSVDDQPIERLRLHEAGWHRFTYSLPTLLGGDLGQAARRAGESGASSSSPDDSATEGGAAGGLRELRPWHRPDTGPSVRFGIVVEPPFVPAATLDGSRDARELGIGLGRLQWSARLPQGDAGFYDWEQFIDGRRFRWTRRQASTSLKTAGPIAVLSLRADNPDIDARPVEVSVFWDERLVGEITLRGRSWVDAEIEIGAATGSEGVLSVRVGRTWVPAQAGVSGDPRVLGVAMTEVGWR